MRILGVFIGKESSTNKKRSALHSFFVCTGMGHCLASLDKSASTHFVFFLLVRQSAARSDSQIGPPTNKKEHRRYGDGVLFCW